MVFFVTVREAIDAFTEDQYDDFFDGPPEYKVKLLRYYGVSEEDISAWMSPAKDNGEDARQEDSCDPVQDAQKETLKWAKRQTWIALIAAVAAVAGAVIAFVSCQRM